MPLQPMIVGLSGSLKGCTIVARTEPVILGADPGCAVRFPPSKNRPVADQHAEIIRQPDDRFKIRTLITDLIIVNDEPVHEALLANNDLIRLGEGGPLIRFRTTGRSDATKTFHQVMMDSTSFGDNPDFGKTGFGRATAIAKRISVETIQHGSWKLRAVIGILTLALLGLTGLVAYRMIAQDDRDRELDAKLQAAQSKNELEAKALRARVAAESADRLRIEKELARERTERAALSESLKRLSQKQSRDAVSLGDLMEKTSAVDATLSKVTRRIEAESDIYKSSAQGVGLIVVGVCFFNPKTNQFIRYRAKKSAHLGLAAGGTGEPFVEWVVGSGFLIDTAGGLLLSNRHVIDPWWENPNFGRGLLQQGYRPVRKHFYVCFPGMDAPVKLQRLAASPKRDVAFAKLPETDALSQIPRLSLSHQETVVSVGAKVVVLGYPEGVEGLINRLNAQQSKALAAIPPSDIGGLANSLSSDGLIVATLTSGVVSDVRKDMLVHGAESTRGGSGGPVFLADGTVVGLNTSTNMQFSGASYALLSNVVAAEAAAALAQNPDGALAAEELTPKRVADYW